MAQTNPNQCYNFLFISPILVFAKYSLEPYSDGSMAPVCLTQANTVSAFTFYLVTISIFFFLPLMVLIILYAIIAKNLILSDTKMKMRLSKPEISVKARKQVIAMLGAVVLSFFICLLPFRLLTLWIIFAPEETFQQLNVDTYYNLLYFCRIMWYLNSAVNPILYNLMSSKFRIGFVKLFRCFLLQNRRNRTARKQRATFNTTTTSSYLTSSHHRRSGQSSRTALSLDDLRIHKQLRLGRLENSSTTSPTSGSDDESFYALNFHKQSSSPLLTHICINRGKNGKQSLSQSIKSTSTVKSPVLKMNYERSLKAPKNSNSPNDLRRLALKNKMQHKKNISFDDSALCSEHRQNIRHIEYRRQISADEALLTTKCSFHFIDETSDVDANVLEPLSPLLDH